MLSVHAFMTFELRYPRRDCISLQKPQGTQRLPARDQYQAKTDLIGGNMSELEKAFGEFRSRLGGWS